MPFLTLEDPNAKIKGSRDPLGTMTLWLAFSRHVITNITTVTTSVRAFTILLLGRYFAERLIDDGSVEPEKATEVVLRLEQAAAYARHVGHGVVDDIRGIERVKRFLSDGKGKVAIQADRRGMILSDQRTYGIWGLYTLSSRRSGLIPDGMWGVTPIARHFLERNYIAQLNGAERSLMRILTRGGTLDTRPKDPVFSALVKILPSAFSPDEAAFYGRYIRDGYPADDSQAPDGEDGSAPAGEWMESGAESKGVRQARLRHLLEGHTDLKQRTTRAEVIGLVDAARPIDEGLANALDRIVHLEALLAPAEAVFDFLLTRTGQTPREVAGTLRERWGRAVPNLDPDAFKDLLGEISKTSSPEIAALLRQTHEALRMGEYTAAARSVIAWNVRVQERRKGAPWIVIDPAGRLDVRYRDLEQPLPEADDLPTLWRNSYLIDSLKALTLQLRNVR